jgi:hypothetical protein
VKVFGRNLAFSICSEFGSYNKKTFLVVLFKKHGDSRHFLDQRFEIFSGSLTAKTAVIPADCHTGFESLLPAHPDFQAVNSDFAHCLRMYVNTT